MKTCMRIVLAAAIAGVSASASAGEVEHGTAEEAVTLVKKAIAYYKANGKEKLAAEINGRTPDFRVKDLYVFVSPVQEGPLLAHGVNAKLVGRTLGDLRDVDGVYFTRKFREVAVSKEGKGWVDYKWPNASSGQLEPKSTYIERVDDMYIGCGIYKPAK